MQQVNTRNLALDILLLVESEQVFSHLAIRRILERHRDLPKRDRAFLTRLAEGTIERQITLDYVINQYAKTKVKKMKPIIRAIVRSATYQILYMDAVPDSAAVNEAVSLTVKRGLSGLKGFVNGLLRTISRNKSSVSYPSVKDDAVRALSVIYSMPKWIVRRFLQAYGAERTESILKAYLIEKQTCVRICPPADISVKDDVAFAEYINKVKRDLTGAGIQFVQDERLFYALHLDGYDTLMDIPAFRDGTLYAQDISSMMVAETAKPERGSIVLDVCAAPGGKSIHMAQLLYGSGMVEARDVSENKVSLIRENIARCHVTNMKAKRWDALVFDEEWSEAADIVIADLPCSGLGVIGTKSDIKYRTLDAHIAELADLQRRILSVVHRYVKPGGMLLYSTCTITAEENEQNTEWFLREHPDFSLVEKLQFLPDEGCDGFYIAKIIRS